MLLQENTVYSVGWNVNWNENIQRMFIDAVSCKINIVSIQLTRGVIRTQSNN